MDYQTKEIRYDFFRGIFTALGAIAEIVAFSIIFNLKIGIEYVVIVLSLSLLVYFADFFKESSFLISKQSGETFSTLQKTTASITMVFLLTTFAYTIIRYGSLKSIIFSAILLVAGLLYDPYLKTITKSITGFKDIYVAICWNTLIILFVLFYNYSFSVAVILFLIFVFSRDMVNASFCDLKDLRSDAQKKLLTFAEVLGKYSFLNFLQVVNIISLIIILFGILSKHIPFLGISLLIPVMLTIFFIEYSRKKDFFSPYFVDLEYFIWLASVLFFKYLIL